jgi:hypothetical protein
MTTFRGSVLVLVRSTPFNYGLVLASLYFLDPPGVFLDILRFWQRPWSCLTFWATALAWVFVLFLWLQYGLFLALHRRREPRPLERLPALLENPHPPFRGGLDQWEELPWPDSSSFAPLPLYTPPAPSSEGQWEEVLRRNPPSADPPSLYSLGLPAYGRQRSVELNGTSPFFRGAFVQCCAPVGRGRKRRAGLTGFGLSGTGEYYFFNCKIFFILRYLQLVPSLRNREYYV